MLCAAPGCASMAHWTSRMGVRLARGIHTGAANWVCPPGRRKYSTSQRATVCAISVPWSSSTSESARSMPAVTPAAVQIVSELRRKIGSASTSMAGNWRANLAAKAQCVVTRQPSSSPASAARNAPVQAVATRRALAATALIQATSSGLERAASTPLPPGSTTVSMVFEGSLGSGSGTPTNARPVAVEIGCPSIEPTTTLYPPLVSSDALAKTSCGPTKSSA